MQFSSVQCTQYTSSESGIHPVQWCIVQNVISNGLEGSVVLYFVFSFGGEVGIMQFSACSKQLQQMVFIQFSGAEFGLFLSLE